MKPRIQPYGNRNLCGRNIERLRKEQKMTQAELAKLTGIVPSNLSKIEGQIRGCRDIELVAIADALGTNPSYLLGLTHWEE